MAKILKSSIPYKEPSSENLIEFIKNGLRKHSKETIIIDAKSDRRWTGREIETTVSRIAKFLVQHCDLKKGDVCSLYGYPDDHICMIYMAVISAGGVANFLTNKYLYREVFDTSKVLGSKYLISTSELLQGFKTEFPDHHHLRVLSYDKICLDGCKSLGPLLEKSSEESNLDELIARANISPATDFAVIQFSSGTTGKPKPIPRTHKNLCHLVASVDHQQLMDLKPGEVITGSLSITHRPGLWAILGSINAGNGFVIWDKLSDVEDGLRVVEKYKVTILSSSLPFLSMLGNTGIKLKDKFDLSSLKYIITSGAKIVHPDLPRSLVKEFKLKSLRQCFGMTEAGWVFLIESSLAEDNYLTVGHVVPGMEAIVMDPQTCEPLGPNVKGEIALKSAQIFPGYLTSEPGVFNRSDFTDQGWFRSGDQAYYDDNGLVFIEGRYKELLIFENNLRYFPTEIEAIISEHPDIEGACVVKVGEMSKPHIFDVARAYVTLKGGSNLTQEALLEFVGHRGHDIVLAGGVRFLDKFPRLENGKVDKQTLKTMK